MKYRVCSLTLVTILSCGAVVSAATVSLESLLDEMVNRSNLASFPNPAYTCKQASSYDRGATDPDKPGWFSNADWSNFIRSEENDGREEWVMMDAEGPGAIVRWWAVGEWKNYKGIIRIYIDGSTTPTIALRIDELVGGEALVGPPLSEVRALGRNLYLPIPYAKRCKVTFDRPPHHQTKKPEDMLFYQINYRTYPSETKVESITRAGLEKAKAKIADLQSTLLDPESTLPVDTQTHNIPPSDLSPEKDLSLRLDGPAAVCRLSVRIEAEDLAQSLRSTVLIMECDGEQTVWCPLGDFFGSGVGVNPFTDWFRKVEKDGTLTCWWVMPYEKSCTFRLKNLGSQTVHVKNVSVDTCPWDWDDRSMHFHANWRQQRNIPTHKDGKGVVIDWNYLTAEGTGVFVGDTLVLLNRHKRWWGEGDEKIYVDGEKFPSHFGTGTEDYYGYSWCVPQFFQSPFHSQPQAEGPNNYGNVTNTRVRLLDAIPFDKAFRFDMEICHHTGTTVDYAAATYWYGRPGATANHQPSPVEAVSPVKYKTPLTPAATAE